MGLRNCRQNLVLVLIMVDVHAVKAVAREGAWVVLGQGASILGSLFLVRALTEILGATQYGELSLGLTVVSLVNQVVMAGILATITRHYAIAVEERQFSLYRQAAVSLMLRATTVVALIGCLMVMGLVVTGHWRQITLSLGALAYGLLSTYNSAFNGIQNASRRRGSVAFHSALDAWLKIAMAFLLVKVMGSSGEVVVCAYVLTSLFVLASQSRQFCHTHPQQTNEPAANGILFWRHRMQSFSAPFAIWGGFTWAQQVTDKWSLLAFGTVDEVGRYAVLYQLGYSPVVIIGGVLMMFLGPIFFQRSGNATDSSRNHAVHNLGWRIVMASLLFTALATLVALTFHDLIFKTFVAASFLNVSRYLPAVVAAGGLFTSGQFLALKIYSEMQSKRMILANTASASLGIGMNVIGAWLFGLNGVVGALLCYSLIYFLWMARLAARRL